MMTDIRSVVPKPPWKLRMSKMTFGTALVAHVLAGQITPLLFFNVYGVW